MASDPTFGAILAATARRQAASVALIGAKRSLTYAELDRAVSNLASNLIDAGIGKQDRIAVFLDASVEAVIAILAAWAAGLIAVPINPKLKPGQVEHILADCTPRVLITTPTRAASLATVSGSGVRLVLVGSESGDLPWSDLVERASTAAYHRCIDNDAAAILYTSGSTGMPKGVVVSHRNLVSGARSVNSYLGTTADDVVLAVLPLSFDAGLSQITTSVMAGATVVLHGFIRAKALIETCDAHGVTMITAVPPLWRQIVDGPWTNAARGRIRLFANTGGHMPTPLLGALREQFPKAQPYLMYGLTEAFRSTYLDPAEVDRRPNSIGKAIPNNEILILDHEGRQCPPGEVGELVHRGALVALGYWNRPEETAARFRPLRAAVPGLVAEVAVWSGDLVEADAEGFLFFRGRRDDMIKTSGYRISPLEIEVVLAEAPGVAETAVFGTDDDDLGQRPVGAIVPSAAASFDGEAIERFIAARLPGYMLPRLWPLPALPRSPNGKIDRPGLRARYRELHS